MELTLLSNYPEYTTRIAHWYFNEWLSRVPGFSVEDVLAKISAPSNRLMVIAKDGPRLLGVAELKEREMDIYPEFRHWLGGVYVDANSRGRGIGSELVREVIQHARQQGIATLYLQTEDLSGGLYKRHGFKAVETVGYKGRTVLVMAAGLCG